MLRVLIADDHPIVREGLKRLVQEEVESQALIEETDQGQVAVDRVKAAEWDLLVLDINLPDKNGLEVLKEVRAVRSSLPVIILSVYPEDQYAIRAFKAGADAYLAKNLAPYEMLKAIEAVRTGQKYVSSSVAFQVMSSQRRNEPARAALHETLSDRELQVLCLFAGGKSSKEIGSILSISEKTVSTYRSRMLMKLHLHTTVDLIRYALEHQIAP